MADPKASLLHSIIALHEWLWLCFNFIHFLWSPLSHYSASHLKRCSAVLKVIYLRQLESFCRPATAVGEGTAQGSLNPLPPVPCIPGFHPFLLHFLPLALFQLQNIMQHCCIFSPYFSHFPPFWNSHLLPPPPTPPPTYSPGCPAPVLTHMIIHPHRCTYFFHDDHNTKVYLPPPPFTNNSLVSFTSHKNKTVKALLDRAYSFSSYPGYLFSLQMPWNPLLMWP